jgi:hypothetical protein
MFCLLRALRKSTSMEIGVRSRKEILDDRPDKRRAPVDTVGRLAGAGFTKNDQDTVGRTAFVSGNKYAADNKSENTAKKSEQQYYRCHR